MESIKTHHRIIVGDSRRMVETGNETVHLVITSPPYWQLKDYGAPNQIGFHDSYEEYINNLNSVWSECYRVLYKGCRLCVNIGDQFARSVFYGRYKVIPIRTEIIKFCESIGFDYMGAVIWQKVTTCNTTGGASVMGSFPYPRNGIIKLDYEFILIFKKLGSAPKVSQKIKEMSKLSVGEWNQYFAGHWTFPGERQDRHLAMFPLELPKRLIRMFSFVGDVVLDPFLGSGTTSLAAAKLHRSSIGYEINEEFLPLIKEKLGFGQFGVFDDHLFEVVMQNSENISPAAEAKDAVPRSHGAGKFDRRVDPRLVRFGSRIAATDQSVDKGRYYSVTQVISPEELVLDNGLRIRLLGIKAALDKRERAVEYLQSITKGQKVFLRFDESKHDDSDIICCYLYLKNKTFVNARLIKAGLADIDETVEFRHKRRFREYGKPA